MQQHLPQDTAQETRKLRSYASDSDNHNLICRFSILCASRERLVYSEGRVKRMCITAATAGSCRAMDISAIIPFLIIRIKRAVLLYCTHTSNKFQSGPNAKVATRKLDSY